MIWNTLLSIVAWLCDVVDEQSQSVWSENSPRSTQSGPLTKLTQKLPIIFPIRVYSLLQFFGHSKFVWQKLSCEHIFHPSTSHIKHMIQHPNHFKNSDQHIEVYFSILWTKILREMAQLANIDTTNIENCACFLW